MYNEYDEFIEYINENGELIREYKNEYEPRELPHEMGN